MSVLFQPVTVGGLQRKNRFVRSATNEYLGRSDGAISEQQMALYRELASGGVGLIITGHAYVQHPLGRARMDQNAIYDDRFIEGYRRLADAVHREGAALVLQRSHAGRQTPQDWPDDQVPAAPSAVRERQTSRTPRALAEEEIWSLIDTYVSEMARPKTAGCDGVQFHIVHGYLLSAFLSTYTNRRTDAWGGSPANRCRLVGGLRSLSVMEHVVASAAADLVALSRPFVCEPDLVNRFCAGQAKAVCSSCNACFNPAGLRCRRPDTP